MTYKSILFVLAMAFSFAPISQAAENNYFGVVKILRKPATGRRILPYSVSLASYEKMPGKAEMKNISQLDSDWLYFTRVRVKGKTYYRLMVGNYAKPSQSRAALARYKKPFPGAWIKKRDKAEKQQLARIVLPARKTVSRKASTGKPIKLIPGSVAVKTPVKSKATRIPAKKIVRDAPKNPFAEKLLSQSRQLLLDRKYKQLVRVSDKVIEIGNNDQKQRAMLFEGLARERQRKFAQAVALYERFFKLYPKSPIAGKISSRLKALKTMNMEPRAKLVKRKRLRLDKAWNFTGSFSQYYRDNINDTTKTGSNTVNSSLLSNVSLYARSRNKNGTTILRFDGGLVNNFLDHSNSTDVSRASVRYTSQESDYEIIGGRQSRTAKGVLGRFDGFVYSGLSNPGFDYSLYAGFPVQSSTDGFQSSRRFIGADLSLNPANKMDLDLYMIFQQNDGLIDRQALGSELQYRNEKGFFYGILDYDFFYHEINDLTAITNYRYNKDLTINATFDYRNSPTLSTLNAIQGQSVTTLSQLKSLYTKDEIYQFAQDRTSKSKNLFLNLNYQVDSKHQLDTSLAFSNTGSTISSGGVAASPSSSDVNLSSSYSINGYFLPGDYTTFGLRLSDTTSSQSFTLSGRARFRGNKGWRYDPRLQLDYRKSKTSAVNQWILRPKFKIKYKPNRKVSFEASVGIDYSNFNLPELSDQLTYNLFIGYVYRL